MLGCLTNFQAVVKRSYSLFCNNPVVTSIKNIFPSSGVPDEKSLWKFQGEVKGEQKYSAQGLANKPQNVRFEEFICLTYQREGQEAKCVQLLTHGQNICEV